MKAYIFSLNMFLTDDMEYLRLFKELEECDVMIDEKVEEPKESFAEFDDMNSLPAVPDHVRYFRSEIDGPAEVDGA